MKHIDISDWNWIVKGKMHGTEKFTNLYNILSNKTKKLTRYNVLNILKSILGKISK